MEAREDALRLISEEKTSRIDLEEKFGRVMIELLQDGLIYLGNPYNPRCVPTGWNWHLSELGKTKLVELGPKPSETSTPIMEMPNVFHAWRTREVDEESGTVTVKRNKPSCPACDAGIPVTVTTVSTNFENALVFLNRPNKG